MLNKIDFLEKRGSARSLSSLNESIEMEATGGRLREKVCRFLLAFLNNKSGSGLKERVADSLLCVGDIVDGIGDVNRSCKLLRDNDVFSVRGNHERWLLKNEMRLFADVHYPEDIVVPSRESIFFYNDRY